MIVALTWGFLFDLGYGCLFRYSKQKIHTVRSIIESLFIDILSVFDHFLSLAFMLTAIFVFP